MLLSRMLVFRQTTRHLRCPSFQKSVRHYRRSAIWCLDWDAINKAIAEYSPRQGWEIGQILSDYQGRTIDASLPAKPLVGHPRGPELFCSIVRETDFDFDRMHYVSLLLELGWDPTVKNQGGQTALHLLAGQWYPVDFDKWVDFLLSRIDTSDRSAFLNAMDDKGNSAICCIYYHYQLPRTEKLLDVSADPFLGDPTRSTLLFDVLRVCYDSSDGVTGRRIMKKMFEKGGDAQVRNHRGETALHVLAETRFPAEFDDFFVSSLEETERAAYVNAMSVEEESAIEYASRSGYSSRVSSLLAIGADPFLGDPTCTKILFNLLNDFMKRECEEVTLRAVVELFELGCDPRVQNHLGQTALHILAKDSARFIRYDFDRWTDLLLSLVDKSQRKAYVNTRDCEVKSAIFYAIDADAVIKLLQVSADPFLGDRTRSIVLFNLLRSLRGDHLDDAIEAFTKLIELGCDVNARDGRGQTALHHLAKKSVEDPKMKLVELFLKSGAKPTIRDTDGKLPFHYREYPKGIKRPNTFP